MVKLIAKLLLIAMLGALSVVDRFTDQIYSQLDDRRTQAPPPPRVSRDTTATSDTRVNGFRTTHVVVPTPALTPYDPLIEQYSTQLAVPADLVRGVVQVESGFNPSARSSAGAMGLMQLMPETAAELGVTNPYDPSENLRGGITYLNQLLEQYDGNEEIALPPTTPVQRRSHDMATESRPTRKLVTTSEGFGPQRRPRPVSAGRLTTARSTRATRSSTAGGPWSRVTSHPSRDSTRSRNRRRIRPCPSAGVSPTRCVHQPSRVGRTETRSNATTRLRPATPDGRCGTRRHAT